MEIFVFDKKGNKLKCSVCGSYLLKNKYCSGDYYPVESGIVLMSYCPQCGLMRPNVRHDDPEIISNNTKAKFRVKICKKYGLGFKSIQRLEKQVQTNVKRKFIDDFSTKIEEEFQIPSSEIHSILM